MPEPPRARGGARLGLAVLALVVAAAGVVVYRTALTDEEVASHPRPDYRALLASDESAIEACRGPEPSGLEGGGPLAGDELVAAIAGDVERIRELEFDAVPDAEVLSSEEMAERLSAEGPPEGVDPRVLTRMIRMEDRILTLLGALDPSVDLRRIFGGTPVGIYLEDDDLVLVMGSEDLVDPDTRVTLAHELAHALVDQHFGIDELRPLRGDAALAARTLLEGDASLTDFRFGRWALSTIDRLIVDFAGEVSELAGAAPSGFLERQSAFPYTAGPAFACFLYLRGGWTEVNEAFGRPPTTSAQILFPGRYFAGEDAIRPEPAAIPTNPWRFGVGYAFGAAHLLWLFEAPGDDPSRALDEPLDRAAAWVGGELSLWVDGDRSALRISLVQRPGEPPLCRSMADWYQRAFPDSRFVFGKTWREWLVADGQAQDAVVSCSQDQIRLGIAPDVPTARALVADL